MTDTAGTATDPLLLPLTSEHRALLEIIGDAIFEANGWPVYQYIEAKLDDRNLDATELFASLPSMYGGHTLYTMVRRDRNGTPDDLVKLTIAGMAHLDQFAGTVDMFLRVLSELRDRRAAAPFDPRRVIEVEISGKDLESDLRLEREPFLALLPDLLQGEPATWHGASKPGSEGWIHKPSSFLRRFSGVRDVNDYLTRLRAWVEPPAPAPAPVLFSPMNLVMAFDYLDVVWRLRFGSQLVFAPGAERTARLAFDANTADEFDNRLSALGEMLKGFSVPGKTEQGTLQRLSAYLGQNLSSEAMGQVDRAIATLQAATHLRNAGQHVGASSKAATALPRFGLAFPIVDYETAWSTVRAHVVEALDTIRNEIRATF